MTTLKKYQIFLFFLCLGITFFTFINSINSKYARLDDWVMLRSEKRHALKDLTLKNVINTFKYSHEGLYHPIITISYTIEKTLFGFTPELFHFDNIMLHLFNMMLVFFIFFKITKSFWLSFIVYVLFAIHPTRVEVVAWIAARKDLLYSLFYLSSIFFYIKTYESKRIKTFIFLSIFCFLLSCLSKPMAITLPFVLLLIDFYTNNVSKKRLKYYLIYISFSLGFIFAALIIHYSKEYIDSHFTMFNHFVNFINAHFNILFYFDKLVLPIKLYCMYPFFYNMKTMPPMYILYSPVILYLMIYLAFLSLKRTKLFFFGFMFFLVTIAPVSGILHIGSFAVADRYTYIPYLGLFFIISKVILYLYEKSKKHIKILLMTFCVIVSISFCYLSYKRTIAWKHNVYGAPIEMKYYEFGIVKYKLPNNIQKK